MQRFSMTTPITSGQRLRTCRACGKKFDYPVNGSAATRHFWTKTDECRMMK